MYFNVLQTAGTDKLYAESFKISNHVSSFYGLVNYVSVAWKKSIPHGRAFSAVVLKKSQFYIKGYRCIIDCNSVIHS